MSEVQHQQQQPYHSSMNGHQSSSTITNNNTRSNQNPPDATTSQGKSHSESSVSPLPSLLTSEEHTTTHQDPSQISNPPHPNAKTTTHVSANGATTSKTNISAPVCKNCKTSTTPLWRRDESGQVLCNACGLFLKLHGRPRPISLKTDVIKSRNRVKNSNSGTGNGSNPAITSKGPDVELKVKEAKKSTSSGTKRDKPTNTPPKLPQSDEQQQELLMSQTSPGLVPLLPRNQTSQTNGKPTPNFFPQFHHLPPHLQSQAQHQQQQQQQQKHVPLHHPSSVPTQFASNLQKITSPLLLSTTPKQHAQVSQLSQAHAAAALKNLSNHTPTADDLKELKRENIQPFSPATALNGLTTTSSNASHNSGTKLQTLMNPASSTFYPSPSFGPQHSLSDLSAFSLTNPSSAINTTIASNTSGTSCPSTAGSVDVQIQSGSGENSLGGLPLSKQSSANDISSNDDVIKLKTRISELELVNDLYKSRIQELENSEGLLKKRIVELEELEHTRKKIKIEANSDQM